MSHEPGSEQTSVSPDPLELPPDELKQKVYWTKKFLWSFQPEVICTENKFPAESDVAHHQQGYTHKVEQVELEETILCFLWRYFGYSYLVLEH